MARHIDKLSEYEANQRYDDTLEEIYGRAQIAGETYSTVQALKAIDPVAYRCGFADWMDSQIQDGVFEVEGY